MKRYILTIILIFSFLYGTSAQSVEENAPKEISSRALFVSVIEDPQVLSSRQEIDKLIDFAKKARIKIFFVQVYRANQSWFSSKVADSRPYEILAKRVGKDPLALLITQAHQEGIEVHAWLNLLSLSVNKDANFVKKYGPDVLTKNEKQKNKIEDYKIDGQYFLEPSDQRVRQDLALIVDEIVKQYPLLDGIQFDYIRYPDAQPQYGYSESNMRGFKETTGAKIIDENDVLWKNWKRAAVTDLLTMLVQKVRLLNPQMQVSTTGCMPYARAYHEAFQDWASWLDSGLVDFVTIMNYSADPIEYARWNQDIKNKAKDFTKIKIGVGAYKFTKSIKGFEEELRSCEKLGNDCAIFYYGSLRENLKLGAMLIK